jgi:hypothetical protein
MDWGVGGDRSFADVVNLVMMPVLQGSDGLRMIRKRHNNFSPNQSDASPTKRTSVRGRTVDGILMVRVYVFYLLQSIK